MFMGTRMKILIMLLSRQLLTIALSLGVQQQESKERSKYKIVAREKQESKESKESKVSQKSKMLRS